MQWPPSSSLSASASKINSAVRSLIVCRLAHKAAFILIAMSPMMLALPKTYSWPSELFSLVVIHRQIEKRKLIGRRRRYPAAACGSKTELGCNAYHQLCLPVCEVRGVKLHSGWLLRFIGFARK